MWWIVVPFYEVFCTICSHYFGDNELMNQDSRAQWWWRQWRSWRRRHQDSSFLCLSFILIGGSASVPPGRHAVSAPWVATLAFGFSTKAVVWGPVWFLPRTVGPPNQSTIIPAHLLHAGLWDAQLWLPPSLPADEAEGIFIVSCNLVHLWPNICKLPD